MACPTTAAPVLVSYAGLRRGSDHLPGRSSANTPTADGAPDRLPPPRPASPRGFPPPPRFLVCTADASAGPARRHPTAHGPEMPTVRAVLLGRLTCRLLSRKVRNRDDGFSRNTQYSSPNPPRCSSTDAQMRLPILGAWRGACLRASVFVGELGTRRWASSDLLVTDLDVKAPLGGRPTGPGRAWCCRGRGGQWHGAVRAGSRRGRR
jgi:hypothetical protein